MKVLEHLEKSRNPLISFELVPPPRGRSVGEIIDIVDILASLNPESDGIQIVEEARCGINVPPGNPSAMADAILKLSVDGGQTKAMGEQGRSYAEEHFSIDACIDEYEEIFRRIAKE